MNWKCPACGANDNQEDLLRCSCGYEQKEVLQTVEKKQKHKKRPLGFTLLAIAFCWLVLGGIGNAILGPAWGVYRLIALVYAITAAITVVGLWKIKRWSFAAFGSWSGVVIILLIAMQIGPFRVSLLQFIIFIFVVSAVLWLLGVYIKRTLNSISEPAATAGGSAAAEP